MVYKWLEEQGFPLGIARRVILRELEIRLNLEAGKLIHQGGWAPVVLNVPRLTTTLVRFEPEPTFSEVMLGGGGGPRTSELQRSEVRTSEPWSSGDAEKPQSSNIHGFKL